MCVGIEYFRDGEQITVHFDSEAAELPVRVRGGFIAFYRWGARHAAYISADNIGGHVRKFPETGWLSLESIRAGQWDTFEPRPVRILASRFICVSSWQVPCYFALKPGEFIQGMLATITPYRRVYVVTVPPPVEYADEWEDWPRIISTSAAPR